jgi:hypothetical protein
MLTSKICYNFSFDIQKAFKGIKLALTSPIKHIKSITEPTGTNYHAQTNLTAEGFDEVANEWQAFYANNPFDMQTFNYF